MHWLTCKMKKLELPHTYDLVKNVLTSMLCPCNERSTKRPHMTRRRRTAMRLRRNEQKKNTRETRKLCKAEAILTNMTECYKMLNARIMGA